MELKHEIKCLRSELDEIKTMLTKVLKSKNHKGLKNNLDDSIFEILRSYQIPVSIKGYHFLKEAITITYHDFNAIGSVTKCIYPDIAKKFNTGVSNVERLIRHAIDIAQNRLTDESYVCFVERPSNSEFIAAITEKFLLESKQQR